MSVTKRGKISAEILNEKVRKFEEQYQKLKSFIESEDWTEEARKQLEIALHQVQEELSEAKIAAGDEAEIRFHKAIEENTD